MSWPGLGDLIGCKVKKCFPNFGHHFAFFLELMPLYEDRLAFKGSCRINRHGIHVAEATCMQMMAPQSYNYSDTAGWFILVYFRARCRVLLYPFLTAKSSRSLLSLCSSVFFNRELHPKIWIKNWKCVLFSAPAHEMKRAVFVCDKMIEVGMLIFCPHSGDFRIFWIFFCSWLRIMTFCF